MDNGEVIPNLDEPWTLAGATVMEWSSGFTMMLVVMEVFLGKTVRYAPILLVVLLGTTFGLAALRRSFPDQDRGVRNYLAIMLGFPPPGIPAPAQFQPIWSGAPMERMVEKREYVELGLDEVLRDQFDVDEEIE